MCCLYCSAVSLAFTLLRNPVWRCLSTQSGQRVWPAGLGLAHWTQRPSDLRSARTCARCCWFFFLYASLRTLLGVWLVPRVSWSAISFWICSINSASSNRGRGFMPFALRRFSEFCRFHSRCFSAHSAQRVCSCTAGWLQRHSPCSLRSCRVRAGFCLRVDGCGFGAWADFFWLGRVDFRLGPDFIRLRVRLGINMVSIKSCGFKAFIPEHAALLDQSEQQNLVGKLTEHSDRLDQMIREHPFTKEQSENSNSDHVDWHIACIHAGYLVHLARKNTEHVNRMPDNDMMAEIAHYAVSNYHDEVLQSEKIIRNQEPSDDEPFPMTRRQVREQALKDCAELADLHTDLDTKVKATQAQADNSPGWCHLCRQTIHGEEAVEHSRICVVAAVHNVFALQEEYESRNNPVLIHIQPNMRRRSRTQRIRAPRRI